MNSHKKYMKRGRPNKRLKIKTSILESMQEMNAPLTISSMARILSDKHNEQISWNTVRKYVREMIETNKIEAILLPHSKQEGKDGLTVYVLKR